MLLFGVRLENQECASEDQGGTAFLLACDKSQAFGPKSRVRAFLLLALGVLASFSMQAMK